jgi:dienelactone hydrolase
MRYFGAGLPALVMLKNTWLPTFDRVKMAKASRRLVAFILLLSVLIGSASAVFSLNTDFGEIAVNNVKIDSDFGVLTGLMYQPANLNGQKFPAVVVAHGISESAQILSGLGLELARNGFVVLVLDLPGHGNSDGYINQGQNDSSLGVDAAVGYLSNLTYVDSTKIGLVGHSLGAGAVRAANTKLSNIESTVLMGGGVGDAASGADYGSFNATYPKNVLVIIGEYDVLFDSSIVSNEALMGLFNTSEPIQPGVLYGNFQSQTARKLLTPPTTHLFESIDPVAIQETTLWMQQALKTNPAPQTQILIYPYRELAQILSLLALFGLVLLAYTPVASFLKAEKKATSEIVKKSRLKFYLLWFILNLALFFPLIAIGFAIGFPSLVFGSSIAWWLLLLALISLAVAKRVNPAASIVKLFKEQLPSKRQLLTAVLLFLILYGATALIGLVGVDLKIVAPIFQEFASIRRFLVFFAFLPFYYPYFIMQQYYLMPPGKLLSGKIEYLKIIFAAVSPFLLLLALNFLPKILFGFWLIPSFGGFLIEFLWLMVPIFALTTFTLVYFYRKTGGYAFGAVFNTLLLAWISATVFPF